MTLEHLGPLHHGPDGGESRIRGGQIAEFISCSRKKLASLKAAPQKLAQNSIKKKTTVLHPVKAIANQEI